LCADNAGAEARAQTAKTAIGGGAMNPQGIRIAGKCRNWRWSRPALAPRHFSAQRNWPTRRFAEFKARELALLKLG